MPSRCSRSRPAHFRRDPGARRVLAARRAGLTTAAKSRSKVTSKPRFRSVLARLRDSETRRGTGLRADSGDHQSTGWPAEYHGKIPRRYAASSRSGERSPPAASSPRVRPAPVERRKPLAIAFRREPGDGLVHAGLARAARGRHGKARAADPCAYRSTCAPSRSGSRRSPRGTRHRRSSAGPGVRGRNRESPCVRPACQVRSAAIPRRDAEIDALVVAGSKCRLWSCSCAPNSGRTGRRGSRRTPPRRSSRRDARALDHQRSPSAPGSARKKSCVR